MRPPVSFDSEDGSHDSILCLFTSRCLPFTCRIDCRSQPCLAVVVLSSPTVHAPRKRQEQNYMASLAVVSEHLMNDDDQDGVHVQARGQCVCVCGVWKYPFGYPSTPLFSRCKKVPVIRSRGTKSRNPPLQLFRDAVA